MDKVAIVIPIYKNNLSEQESISLKQCFKLLSKFPIYFIAPKSINKHTYTNYGHAEYVYFKNDYFSNINGYNRLMLSSSFYKAFSNYEYILVYQLDSFVFKNELLFWCEQGYDFIGAPTTFPIETSNGINSSMMVGNGGFSLRKTKTFIDALTKFKVLPFIKNDTDFPFPPKTNNAINHHIKLLIKKTGIKNNNFSLLKSFMGRSSFNEDFFWSILAPKIWRYFKLPSIEIACKFALERDPELYYKINKNEISFGCHAWSKYNPAFWQTFINQ